MKRRSTTKPPHDPHELFLDEGISGPALASLLRQGRIVVHEFEKLLKKNKKIPDNAVIEATAGANYVLVTKDKRMETDWTEEIIAHKSRIILLTDEEGGPIHWAAALICGQVTWERALLDHPHKPMIVRINRAGQLINIAGEVDLRDRRDHVLTARVSRQRRHRSTH